MLCEFPDPGLWACQLGWVIDQQIQVAVEQEVGHHAKICAQGLQQRGRLHRCRYIMASCSPWVTQCAIASHSWKEESFSQLFKKKERKLYSANKLLTLNYSLSSMAQSLLPQFSLLHMKYKISFLKAFSDRNWWDGWSQNWTLWGSIFWQRIYNFAILFFQDLVLFLLNWKKDLPMT